MWGNFPEEDEMSINPPDELNLTVSIFVLFPAATYK